MARDCRKLNIASTSGSASIYRNGSNASIAGALAVSEAGARWLSGEALRVAVDHVAPALQSDLDDPREALLRARPSASRPVNGVGRSRGTASETRQRSWVMPHSFPSTAGSPPNRLPEFAPLLEVVDEARDVCQPPPDNLP